MERHHHSKPERLQPAIAASHGHACRHAPYDRADGHAHAYSIHADAPAHSHPTPADGDTDAGSHRDAGTFPHPTVSPCQLQAWVVPAKPLTGSSATVYGELTCQGRAVARAQVYVICRYRALNARYPESGFVETDAEGLARIGFDTRYATPGETVRVEVYARYGGRDYRAQTSFQPQ